MRKGFTLVEILIPLALLLLFFSMAFFIFDPTEEFSRIRNVRRWGDLNRLLQASFSYNVSNNNRILLQLGDVPKEICSEDKNCDGLINLSILVEGSGIDAIPRDPLCATVCPPLGTGYLISRDKVGHLILSARSPELGEIIRVVR